MDFEKTILLLSIASFMLICLILFLTIRGTFRVFKKFLFELIDKIKE